jgi:hypothetical protein
MRALVAVIISAGFVTIHGALGSLVASVSKNTVFDDELPLLFELTIQYQYTQSGTNPVALP